MKVSFKKRILSVIVALSLSQVGSTHKLTIDCANKLRGATHCANGSLYGIIENVPGDYKSLVDPIHPFVMRNPARGGNGNQHPYGDAIKVAQRLSQTPGAVVSVDFADILPNWPYRWPGLQKWLDEVKSFINDKKKSGLTNWYGYEIWNEPDGTWKDADGINFNELWRQTYQVMRQNDPNEKIIGPCDSWYNENRMRSFLQYAKTNNCLPDIMCWHELSGIENVSNHLKAYRNLEKSLGIKELPITINEYCDAKHEWEGQPGSSARFIGKFERYKVDSALISWWFVPHPGRLGSLLATDTQKGAGWYFYKWYGDMTGDMVYVEPPNDNSDLVDGAACVDASQQYVSFIFGGKNDGTINASFKNLPSFIGSNANVKVEKVDWRDKDSVCPGPNTIFEKKYPVTNGQITVDITGCNGTSGYRVYITGDGSPSAGGNTGGNTGANTGANTGGNTGVNTGGNTGANTGANTGNTGNTSGNNGGYTGNTGNTGGNNGGYTGNTGNTGNTGGGYTGNTGNTGNTAPTNGNTFKIINRLSGKALSVNGDSTANEANVIQWTDNGKTSQQWIITQESNGYKIINVNANKALDVYKNSRDNGGNVIIWYDNGASNQRWNIQEVGNGYYTLQNLNSGKLLDVEKESRNDGGNVLQWVNNGNTNQQWQIVSVNGGNSGTTNQNQNQNQNVNNPQPISNATADSGSCSSRILNQGYKCCSDNCKVVYTDEDGTWGYENNQWCGCTIKSSAAANCSAKFTSLGYSCCSDNNCVVYTVDSTGNWGVENNEWCGISNSCNV
ncbi:hypothetical protein BCR32DRAFT_325253 [Anaeromyces robustus]|uniref:CBM10 domain-containing protein n=1 Tax=Anaeromyces robustus TaxID=1754192 RepID=A0A1Y1XJD6_9FUNG|nr:hypothetical protein BCR32DRAFT_325253 [Anaeromyces robustus]|eukprot:ORX85855.1 hypothetical protein BCR32DRAFT_325253 [Anaeromyces robustus]